MIDHSLVTGFTMFIRRSFDMTCFGISTYHRHEPPLCQLTVTVADSAAPAADRVGLTLTKDVEVQLKFSGMYAGKMLYGKKSLKGEASHIEGK